MMGQGAEEQIPTPRLLHPGSFLTFDHGSYTAEGHFTRFASFAATAG
jgi:hypothetical protein